MKTGIRLIICCIIVSISALLGKVQAGESSNSASQYLCDYGINLYKEGSIADAIHELKKSLQINPNNALAKEYLDKILAEQNPQKVIASEVDNSPESQAVKLKEQLEYLKSEYLQQSGKLQQLREQVNEQKRLESVSGSDLNSKLAGLQEERDALQMEKRKLQEKSLAEIEGLLRIVQGR